MSVPATVYALLSRGRSFPRFYGAGKIRESARWIETGRFTDFCKGPGLHVGERSLV